VGANDPNVPGPGFGLAVQDFYPVSITENAFEGNLAAAMWFYSNSETEVTNNTSKDDGSFLVCTYCGRSFFFDHNQGQDFGAQGFLPVYGTTNADAAIDLLYSNSGLQINDNVLEGAKTPGYSGIAFSTIAGVDHVCDNCEVSNNTITRFAGNGIVAEESTTADTSSLYDSMISRNDLEDNGNDGILIAYAPDNYYNSVLDNKAKDNHVFDCEDDTVATLSTLIGTLGTADTWFNNVGSLSHPKGLCTPRFVLVFSPGGK
jgi:hypothetical protein